MNLLRMNKEDVATCDVSKNKIEVEAGEILATNERDLFEKKSKRIYHLSRKAFYFHLSLPPKTYFLFLLDFLLNIFEN